MWSCSKRGKGLEGAMAMYRPFLLCHTRRNIDSTVYFIASKFQMATTAYG
jgi:hypothetical protein